MIDTIMHVFIWGSILSAGIFALAIGGYLIDPEVLGGDLGWPEENQNKLGGGILAILIVGFSIGLIAYAGLRYELIDPDVSFWKMLLIGYFIFQIFNIADLFVLDWLIYMKMKPTFMRPAHLPVADDFSKHLKGAVNGLYIGILPALLGTGLWYLWQ